MQVIFVRFKILYYKIQKHLIIFEDENILNNLVQCSYFGQFS